MARLVARLCSSLTARPHLRAWPSSHSSPPRAQSQRCSALELLPPLSTSSGWAGLPQPLLLYPRPHACAGTVVCVITPACLLLWPAPSNAPVRQAYPATPASPPLAGSRAPAGSPPRAGRLARTPTLCLASPQPSAPPTTWLRRLRPASVPPAPASSARPAHDDSGSPAPPAGSRPRRRPPVRRHLRCLVRRRLPRWPASRAAYRTHPARPTSALAGSPAAQCPSASGLRARLLHLEPGRVRLPGATPRPAESGERRAWPPIPAPAGSGSPPGRLHLRPGAPHPPAPGPRRVTSCALSRWLPRPVRLAPPPPAGRGPGPTPPRTRVAPTAPPTAGSASARGRVACAGSACQPGDPALGRLRLAYQLHRARPPRHLPACRLTAPAGSQPGPPRIRLPSRPRPALLCQQKRAAGSG
nr:translation initiation factor IF-2-like [Aegilops tauschii subsp. strangulata]